MTEANATITQSKPIPVWASLLIIILCLGGGGWIMHWYISTDVLSHEATIIDKNPQPRGYTGGRSAPVPAPTIEKQDDTHWIVHSPEARMRVAVNNGQSNVDNIVYSNYGFVPQEQLDVIAAGRRLDNDPNYAKSINMTADQSTKLKALNAHRVTMIVDPTDKQHLLDLWNAYNTATDKAAPQSEMIQALSDVAHKSVDSTKQAAAERAQQIKAMLTDDQIKQLGLTH